MASALEGLPEASSVTYEQLNEIQEGFDNAEIEIIRHQVHVTKPLYDKRSKLVAEIPNFWPLVIEQAPPDIDEYIQPSDSALLLSSLRSLSVSHFEIEDGGLGDPRSISIKWEFKENDHFEDQVIEKKFWYRRAKDGWSGLVSEPVDIKWKPGKDLTGGLLSLVKQVWDEEQELKVKSATGSHSPSKLPKELTPAQKTLKKKIESAGGVGGVSFFAWFGFRGKKVTAEESRLHIENEQEKRRLRLEGKQATPPPPAAAENEEEDNNDDEGEDEEDDEALEVFPGGDELAICITDDLWQDAIKYFMQAQEEDANSDDDFESDEDDGIDDSPSKTPDQRPMKKQKI